MMILITIVSLVLFLITIGCDFNCFFAACFLIGLITVGILTGHIVNGRILDDKIKMYTDENEKIETQINTLVTQYMEYESNTYGELKGESSITLVSLYPELKSDVLVTKQIEMYIENNEKIKELKNDLITMSSYKWWAYFGR